MKCRDTYRTPEGIDYQSREFIDRDGKSRILYLWDQTLDAERVDAGLAGITWEEPGEFDRRALPPEGFALGVEFDNRRINAALHAANPNLVVPSFDTSGHGTAVAAIAAAGGSLLDGRYQGVAPQSSLIVVKLGSSRPDSFPRTTELMRALTYMVRKAVLLGMPLAINLSFGNTYGSHDGTSLLERFLDNVAEIGRCVICVGSGNEGAAGGHISGRIQAGGRSGEIAGMDLRRVELNVGSYQPAFSVQNKRYTKDPKGRSKLLTIKSSRSRTVLPGPIG